MSERETDGTAKSEGEKFSFILDTMTWHLKFHFYGIDINGIFSPASRTIRLLRFQTKIQIFFHRIRDSTGKTIKADFHLERNSILNF